MAFSYLLWNDVFLGVRSKKVSFSPFLQQLDHRDVKARQESWMCHMIVLYDRDLVRWHDGYITEYEQHYFLVRRSMLSNIIHDIFMNIYAPVHIVQTLQ